MKCITCFLLIFIVNHLVTNYPQSILEACAGRRTTGSAQPVREESVESGASGWPFRLRCPKYRAASPGEDRDECEDIFVVVCHGPVKWW